MTTKKFFLLYLFTFGSLVFGDTATDATNQADRIIRHQQQQLEAQKKEEQNNRSQTLIPVETIKPKPKTTQNSCRMTNQIILENAPTMYLQTKEVIINRYINQCLGVSEIEHLIADIINDYIERGYIMARAYVQPQDLSKGVLKILVVEGQVEKFTLDKNETSNLDLDTAFPWTIGKPLNLRDIEQGLDQINRLRSNNASMEIKAGTKSGDSEVIITNTPSFRGHFNLSYDNYGSVSTGANQVGVYITADNPLYLNDMLTLSHTTTTTDNYTNRHSVMTSVSYSIPLGYSTLSLSNSRSDFATLVNSAGGDLLSEGNTMNTTFTLEHVAYRNKTDLLSLHSFITSKANWNYFEHQFLAVSSRKLVPWTIGLTYNTTFLNGSLSINTDFIKGMKWFDALEDPEYLPTTSPHAQFEKWSYSINWYKPFAIKEQNLIFSTSLSAQHAKDVLYGSEQFSIGGLFSVRGYRNNSISGDSGYYVRNDLFIPSTLTFESYNIKIKPSISFDMGKIKNHHEQEGGRLSGGSLGLNIAWNQFSLDISANKAFSYPDSMKDEGTLYFAKLSANF